MAAGVVAGALGSPGAWPYAMAPAAAVPSAPPVRSSLWAEQPVAPTGAWIAFCAKRPAECRVDLSEPSSIALTLAAWESLVAVNEHVNAAIKAVPDREHWGVADRWDYPDDGIGDCEDIQLLKRKLLVEAGLPRRALRMAVVFDETGEGHAVLMALTDRGAFVLDNKRDAVLPWNRTGYTYVKREGSDGLAWASLVGRLTPVKVDVAAELRETAVSAAPAGSAGVLVPEGV